MDKTGQTLNDMSDILKLQLQVAEIAEENKKKVAALQAKFEKVEKEAYDECPVCYGSISVKNTCCMPNCDHKMCKNCYYNWLDKQEKNTCPMCREEVFKNNLDIKTKRSTLQQHLDSLESEVAEMYHERRHIRKSVGDTMDELNQLEDDVHKLHDKHEQLMNEIFDKKQIIAEQKEYEKRFWKRLLEEEVDLSDTNMFDEPEDLLDTMVGKLKKYHERTLEVEYRIIERDPRSEHKFKLEDSLYRIQKYKLYKSAYNYGRRIPQEEVNEYESDSESDLDSMPDLIDATDQELEDTVLNETTFSQDELEYDRAALNVPSPLEEEGEIVEPPTLTRVNRRLNFNYTDSQNALDRFNSVYDVNLIVDRTTREVRARTVLEFADGTSSNYSQIMSELIDNVEDAIVRRSSRV